MFEVWNQSFAARAAHVVMVCLLAISCVFTAVVPEYSCQEDVHISMEWDGESDESEDNLEESKILPAYDSSADGLLEGSELDHNIHNTKLEMVHLDLHLPPPESLA